MNCNAERTSLGLSLCLPPGDDYYSFMIQVFIEYLLCARYYHHLQRIYLRTIQIIVNIINHYLIFWSELKFHPFQADSLISLADSKLFFQ